MEDPSVRRTQTLLKIGTAIFLLAMAGLCIWAWRAGLFRDVEALQSFIDSKVAFAPLIFLLLYPPHCRRPAAWRWHRSPGAYLPEYP